MTSVLTGGGLLRAAGGRLTHGDGIGQHRHAGEEHLLHPMDDHLVTGLQAGFHDPQAVDLTAQLHVAALGLVLGGAIGNIVDRVRLGYVVDYADLHFGEWRPFLIFNLADAAITIGVLILLARALLLRDKGAKTETLK